MALALAIAAAVLGVPLLGVALALIQLGAYRALAVLGRIAPERIPWFGVLWLRGMILAMAILAGLAIASRLAGGGAAPA